MTIYLLLEKTEYGQLGTIAEPFWKWKWKICAFVENETEILSLFQVSYTVTPLSEN